MKRLPLGLRLGAWTSLSEVRLLLAALLCRQGSDHHPDGMAQGLAYAAGPRSNAANGIVESMLLPTTLKWHLFDAGAVRLAEALLG